MADSPYQVEISDEQSRLEVPHPLLTEVVERVLADEKVDAAEIGLALVDDPAIHELNRRYLQHDCPTDVLSFLLEESGGTGDPRRRGAGKTLEGEVVVSTDTAAREASEFRWSPVDEVVLYLVHGLLHLTGYDDQSEEERTLMRQRERELLALWDLEVSYDRPEPDGGESPATGNDTGASP